MKTIEIKGKNYFGKWDKSRSASRGIIIKDGKILLSYETLNDQWMIPGGGLEEGETDKECCIREIKEETGVVIKPSECLLEIDEYYEDYKYISKYFFGEVTGSCERKPTEGELKAGMEPRWIPVAQAMEIFSKHDTYAGTDEMRRGMYLREYTALSSLLSDNQQKEL